MDSLQDAVSGRSISVVYEAPQLPLARGASRWARSGQIRRHAKRAGATHLLRVVDPRGVETESWWAGTAGVSLAAAIDEWADAAEGVDNDVVLIPFDRRIYAAELEGGLVEKETVFAEGMLSERMGRWAGRTVRGFAGGRLGDVLREVVAMEPAPFDFRRKRYRRALVAMTAAGMFAPAQAAAVGAGVVLAATAVGFGEWREGRAEGAAEDERAAAARAAALSGDFTGGRVIDGAAVVAWEPATLLLHRDGLREMSYLGGFEVAFSGSAGRGFPSSATLYAEASGARIEVEGSAWRITRSVAWPAGDAGSVEAFGSRGLAESLHAAAEEARALVSGARVVGGAAVEERGYTLRIPDATANDLAILAARFAGRPYRVAALRCAFEGYLASLCEIEVWTKGVSET